MEFAKHLNENQMLDEPAVVSLNITEVVDAVNEHESSEMKKVIKTTTMHELNVLVDNFAEGENKHTLDILKMLEHSHPNIAKYYFDDKYPLVRITDSFWSVPLEQFLADNKKTISLSTKFDIMSQLCHALQFMHKKFVGCFVRPQDVVIDQNFKVKIRNLSYAYAVNPNTGWKDSKSTLNNPTQNVTLSVDYAKSTVEFPYINISNGV